MKNHVTGSSKPRAKATISSAVKLRMNRPSPTAPPARTWLSTSRPAGGEARRPGLWPRVPASAADDAARRFPRCPRAGRAHCRPGPDRVARRPSSRGRRPRRLPGARRLADNPAGDGQPARPARAAVEGGRGPRDGDLARCAATAAGASRRRSPTRPYGVGGHERKACDNEYQDGGRRRFGSVRRLPSGRYQARYRDETGTEYTAAGTFSTKTSAAR